jgi:hypothetical protein
MKDGVDGKKKGAHPCRERWVRMIFQASRHEPRKWG